MAAAPRKTSTQNPAAGPAPASSPAYVVFGAEGFLKSQAIRRLLDGLLKPDERAMCLSEYEGPGAELATVLDDLRTLPFLGPRRVVILRDADPFITAHRQSLEDYLGSPSPTGTLIVECRTFQKTTKLYKRLSPLGGCIECEEMKAYELPAWLTDRSQKEYGKRLEPDAARSLVDHVGDSMGMLDGELSKLAVYVGNRGNITIGDVEKLVGHDREEKVFGILTAMAQGDRATAMRLWEEVWQTDRAAEGRAIGGIAYCVRKLLDAHGQVLRGTSMFALARQLFTNEERLKAQLRVFPPERLHRQLADLCEADLASKTGARSVRTSVERFILAHTAVRGR
jgi:DNA polymerase III subunit delta